MTRNIRDDESIQISILAYADSTSLLYRIRTKACPSKIHCLGFFFFFRIHFFFNREIVILGTFVIYFCEEYNLRITGTEGMYMRMGEE